MALAHMSTMPKVSQGCFPLKQTMPYGFSYFNWIAFKRIRKEAEGKHRNWIQFYLHSNKNWDQEHLSPTGDGCSMLKKRLWCPLYLLLRVRLYLKLLRCIPIFARKDRTIFIWWLHCILSLGRGALLSLAFSGVQKEQGAGLNRSIISVLFGRTVVPATS